MKDFNNKVAAITGAGSGIGQQLALLLAKEGCHLSLADVNEAGLQNTLSQLKNSPVKVTTAKVDVSNRDAVKQWAIQTVSDHGKVNLIFNNAGVALGSAIDGMSYDDLEWIMNINFWGVVYGTKEFLPFLKASGEGHIVNISSIFGITAQPSQSAYNASKFAVRGFTESLRQELDIQNNGVSATCVHPGGIRTNIAKAARMDDSMRNLGLSPDSVKEFDKLLRTPPESAAAQILDAVRHNKRRLLIGADAKAVETMQRLLPSAYQKIMVLGTKFQTRKARVK